MFYRRNLSDNIWRSLLLSSLSLSLSLSLFLSLTRFYVGLLGPFRNIHHGRVAHRNQFSSCQFETIC